eukprot:PhM_4_TR5556/c0_g1_i1/m.2826
MYHFCVAHEHDLVISVVQGDTYPRSKELLSLIKTLSKKYFSEPSGVFLDGDGRVDTSHTVPATTYVVPSPSDRDLLLYSPLKQMNIEDLGSKASPPSCECWSPCHDRESLSSNCMLMPSIPRRTRVNL